MRVAAATAAAASVAPSAKLHETGADKQHAEPRAFSDTQSAAWQRPGAGAAHAAIGLALPDLVQRCGSAGHERCADQRVRQRAPSATPSGDGEIETARASSGGRAG